mgnify:CR=1 FL=1
MQRLFNWLAMLPTTNARIAVTLTLVVATAVRYLGWGVPQGFEQGWKWWLVFLAGMSGIDVFQFWLPATTCARPRASSTRRSVPGSDSSRSTERSRWAATRTAVSTPRRRAATSLRSRPPTGCAFSTPSQPLSSRAFPT